MKEIYGRKLKLGDLVIGYASNRSSMYLSKDSFCIIVGEERLFNGSEFKCDTCYLIENLSEVDINCKKRLETLYMEHMQKEEEHKKYLQQKRKEKLKEVGALNHTFGDIFLYKKHYWVCIGYCQVDYDSKVLDKEFKCHKEGYTYLRFPYDVTGSLFEDKQKELEKLKMCIFGMNSVSFKDNFRNQNLKFFLEKSNQYKAAIFEAQNSFIVSKKYSTCFLEKLAHVTFTDFEKENLLGGIFYYRSSSQYDDIKINYLHE